MKVFDSFFLFCNRVDCCCPLDDAYRLLLALFDNLHYWSLAIFVNRTLRSRLVSTLLCVESMSAFFQIDLLVGLIVLLTNLI